MDPKAEMLRSQLEVFFPGPSAVASSSSSGYDEKRQTLEPERRTYEEFDDEDEDITVSIGESSKGPRRANAPDGVNTDVDGDISMDAGAHKSNGRVFNGRTIICPGYDELGRRGGVWVRKPRSSRKGSGGEFYPIQFCILTRSTMLMATEAFIVCRNFDPSTVPLPTTFSQEALAQLAKQTSGTLTLESLAELVGDSDDNGSDSKLDRSGSSAAGWLKGKEVKLQEWEVIKAHVGNGDLK